MAGSSKGRDPCVIVVGDSGSEFVREMVQLAGEYPVEPVPCEDVYGAVAQMAAAGRRALIVGALRELEREDGRLFPLAQANAARCCCLLEKGTPARHDSACAAVQAGATVVGEMREVRAVLEDWLAHGRRRSARTHVQNPPPEELQATEAELNALFGRQVEA
jgi:hypothetical protein